MSLHPFVFSPLVALTAGAIVYAEDRRRGLSPGGGLTRGALVALLCLGTYPAVYALRDGLLGVYVAAVGGPVVVTSPRTLVTALFAVATVVCLGVVVGYALVTRLSGPGRPVASSE